MESHTVEQKSGKEFKDTFFRALFHEEERALELCNAVENTNFPRGTPVKFYSRGDTSLTRRNNDLAFIVNEQLLAFKDHQGTLNPNMPLRFLPNVAETLYTWLDDKKALYKNKLVTIPTPKFYVLYNGKDELKQDILRLSDAFRFNDHSFSMELIVKVININHESGSEVLSKSPSLGGYAYLVSEIRKNTERGMARDKAIALAVTHCIEKGILADFLKHNYKEVCGMFDWGITIEEEMEIRVEEAIEAGMEMGRKKGIEQGYLEAAISLIQSGTSFQDVVRVLKLSDTQIQNLKDGVA